MTLLAATALADAWRCCRDCWGFKIERGCLRDRVGEEDAGLGRDSLEDGLDTGGEGLSSGEDRDLLFGWVSGNLCATQ